MMTTISRKLFLALAGASLLFAAPAPAAPNLVTGNNAFALDLYTRLQTTPGNLFFSPYSISTCLAMTYAGAHGDTADQIAHVFHFYTEPVQLADAFADLQHRFDIIQQSGAVELNLANGLWAQNDRPILPKFTAVLRERYQAALEQVDFKNQAALVRQQINDWVSQKTKTRITDLLPTGSLTADTRLVLVNAIYFKGTWARPFNKTITSPGPFNLAAGQPVTTSFMRQENTFNYSEPPGCQLLELPYSAGDPSIQANTTASAGQLVMDILLPRETNGLAQLTASLNGATLAQWFARTHREKVNISLPKFTTTAQFNLAQTLAAMGMPLAFSDRADFSGMDGIVDLNISTIVHKAFIEVDEAGTEAAAATATGMAAVSAMRAPPPEFRADHPFLYLIRDTQSGAILFLGRLTDPTK